MKKSNRLVDDEYENEIVSDKRQKRKFADRRKQKRIKNALRNLDVDQLSEIEEDFYWCQSIIY